MAQKRNKIKDVEHQGDNIVHSIYNRLTKTFITPIDREDISKLASLYDDVLDYIYAAVNRLYLYEISSPTEPMRKFTELVVKSVREIDFAFASIQKINAPKLRVVSLKWIDWKMRLMSFLTRLWQLCSRQTMRYR